ncbi:MAG: DUF6491 family protein [Pseudomonadales bacterium]
MAGIDESAKARWPVALALLTLCCTQAALASAPLVQTQPTASAPALVQEWLASQTSEQVDHIPGVHRIEHWQALGTRHLVLGIDAKRSYLLTLAGNCHQLGWAQSVDVSRSGTAIWSQFDYVNADGRRCNIGTIHKLGASSLKPE